MSAIGVFFTHMTEITLGFDTAILILKNGRKVARKGWNGTGMFIYYVPGGMYPAQTDVAKAAFPKGLVPYRGYLAIKTVDGDVVPWIASQSDLLMDDWYEVTD